jgi:hypothetical protein
MKENSPLTNPNSLVILSDEQIESIRITASILGRIGGKSTSDAKRKAAKENGKKGGRPKKDRL